MKNVMLLVALMVMGCGAFVPPPTCPGAELNCGSFCCPDSTHYACGADKCELVACDTGFKFCGSACIDELADCCNEATGSYCSVGSQCCGGGCVPVLSVCCGNNTYCPLGRVCCFNGTECC